MQSILISLLSSFRIGVPALVYDATYHLIDEIYGYDAANHFSSHVKAIENTYYYRDGSPTADDFIREFEKIS